MNNYVYVVGKNLYINLTNQCSNSCSFCIRNGREGMNGTELWLETEPTSAAEVIEKIPDDLSCYNEVVFCGFGEPTYKMELLSEVGRYVKGLGKITRVNTNGQANMLAGHDVSEMLVGAIDRVNVSLNASNAKAYQAICNSVFGLESFDEMLNFALLCQGRGLDVSMSIVDIIGEEEIEKCKKLCEEKGLKLRVRKFE